MIYAAAQLAPRLANDSWKLVPDNAVPASIDAGNLHLNAAQFLRLMAQAYLDPAPEKVLKVNGVVMFSAATTLFPRNSEMMDQGNGWTFKPAPLRLDVARNPVASR